MGKQKPLLSVVNLSVGYGNKKIVKNVSFDVKVGEVLVLVGPNGCGKSTLLKAMARVLKPISGEVLLDGVSIHSQSSKAVAKKLAFLPQGPIAPEGLSVRELVAQGRFPHQSFIRQWSRQDNLAVERAMSDACVIDFADKAVSSLSGGQRQRVWIAMVLAQETNLLLLDEPTTFLDMKVQVDVLSLLMKATSKSSRTLVLVLHELNMACAFANRMIMMRDGEILALGSPDEIFNSKNLDLVFSLDATVIKDPNHGHPVCLPKLSFSSFSLGSLDG